MASMGREIGRKVGGLGAVLILIGAMAGDHFGQEAPRNRDFLAEARAAFGKGDFAAARVLLEPLAASKGATADVLALLGLSRLQLAKPDTTGAITVLRRALALEPQHAEANFACGLMLNRQKQPREALRHLKRVVVNKPDWADGRLQAGVAFYELGQLANAEGEFRRATSLPAAVEYLAIIESKRGRHGIAAELMRRLLERGGKRIQDRGRVLYQQGAYLRKAGRDAESLTCLEGAEKLGFDRLELHELKGDIHYDAGRLAEALAAYRQGLDRPPLKTEVRDARPTADLHYGIGLILFRQRNWSEAHDALRRAVGVDPFHPNGWYKLGQALQRLKRKKEAKDALVRHRDVERLNKQLSSARRSLLNQPGNIKNRFAYATLLEMTARPRSAFDQLRIVEQTAPDSVGLYPRLRDLSRKLGRQDLEQWYEQKILSAPKTAPKAPSDKPKSEKTP